jgi:hypothetical protein
MTPRTPENGAADDERDSEAYEYEENYDNDGSVPWDVVYAPPPVPPAPGKPPVPAAPRKPTSDEVAAIGKASASTSTYYPYHDRVVRAAPWGARSTPSSANDGALKPREPDAEAAKAAQAARAAQRAKEERWKQLEADGGKLASRDGEKKASSSSSSSSSVSRPGEKDEPSPREEKTLSSKRPSSVSSAAPEKTRAKTETRETRGGDYDDAWLGDVRAKGTMNRAEKKQSVLSEREFRETFVGADYDDDVSALLKRKTRSSRGKKEMTEEEIASARAGGLMASLGAKKPTSADVESYEADLAAGRVFASPEEEAEAKAEAKARYEAEVAREAELERARNADGSIKWDAPREVREALEAEAANVDAETRGGAVSDAQTVARKKFREGERPTRSRAVNPDGSVPWDAPEVPTYVFNEELRSRLGGEEGEDTSLAWDAKPESELVSSFVSAKEETSGGDDRYDPQDSDEGAVAWTVAFDADAAAGDGALDAARLAEEAYDPSQSDHYLDDLLRPSDELLDAGVFGDEVAAVGKPRRDEGAKQKKERDRPRKKRRASPGTTRGRGAPRSPARRPRTRTRRMRRTRRRIRPPRTTPTPKTTTLCPRARARSSLTRGTTTSARSVCERGSTRGSSRRATRTNWWTFAATTKNGSAPPRWATRSFRLRTKTSSRIALDARITVRMRCASSFPIRAARTATSLCARSTPAINARVRRTSRRRNRAGTKPWARRFWTRHPPTRRSARAAAAGRSPAARTLTRTRSGASSSTHAWSAIPSSRVRWRRRTACRSRPATVVPRAESRRVSRRRRLRLRRL